MAIDLTLKGTAITNRQANPRVLNNPGQGEGALEKCTYGILASVPAALSATSIIRLCQVPSNAVVTDLRLSSGAQAAGVADVGIYRTNNDGGAVVDADFFGTLVSVAAASVNVDILNESTTNTLQKQAQPLWQAAGMTVDPKSDLDLALTITTDITTGLQPVALRCRYVQ